MDIEKGARVRVTAYKTDTDPSVDGRTGVVVNVDREVRPISATVDLDGGEFLHSLYLPISRLTLLSEGNEP